MVVHAGTSGWSHDYWQNLLYPPGPPSRDRLCHYVQRFDTVELNSSFCRWPGPSRFAGWRTRLPPGFVMSVKAPRGLTYGKKSYAPEQWVARIAAGWHELRDKRPSWGAETPPLPGPRTEAGALSTPTGRLEAAAASAGVFFAAQVDALCRLTRHPWGYLLCVSCSGGADMPKTTKTGTAIKDELPSTLQRSGAKAQQTFAETYDSAIDQYGGDEQRAHQVAFASLKHTHEKVGDHWEPKEQYGPSDAQAEGGTNTSRPTAGGVDANASKQHLYELATRLGVAGRSKMSKDELVTALQKANDRASAQARAE